jgi:Pyridoxal phosphate biosynthetic protein PdxA
MLCFDDVKIVHATLHRSVRRAIDMITRENIARVIAATDRALKRMGTTEASIGSGIGLPRSNALTSRIIWVTVSCGGSSSPNADARLIKASLARRTRARSSSATEGVGEISCPHA